MIPQNTDYIYIYIYEITEIILLIFLNLFIFYFWLHWVFVAVRGLSLVAARGATLRCGARASRCSGFSCCGARALGMWASVVVAHRLSCSVACGIFPDQGSHPCPLRWQVDS